MRNFKYFLLILLIYFYTPAKPNQNKLVIHGAYAFETFKGQKSCAVYLSFFNNTNTDFEINSLSSNIADKAEIHGTFIDKEVVKMKKIEKLKIKSKDQVYLQPGGMHIMLMGLKKELIDGTTFPIDFLINNKEKMKINVMVVSSKLRENFIE